MQDVGGGWPDGAAFPISFGGLGVVARRRFKGRFVGPGDVCDDSTTTLRHGEPEDGSTPKQRRKAAQVQIAEALPEIVEEFLKKAKGGSIPHAKALAALGDMERVRAVSQQRSRRREQSLTERLMRELRWGREAETAAGAEERVHEG